MSDKIYEEVATEIIEAVSANHIDINRVIKILENHFEESRLGEAKFIALKNAGVDNWEGYGDAMEDFWENNE